MSSAFEQIFQESFVPLDSHKRVGDYVLGRTIGEGSFSTVRLGRNVNTGEQTAIKIIPKKTALKKQSARRRFERETQALRIVHHSNIVRLLDVMETDGNYYIILELMEGENFNSYLNRKGPLEEREARVYMRQMAEIVHHMHSVGVVHRDLKPDNFILMRATIKLVDFGLSGFLKEGSTLSTQCGSPTYTAPEIFALRPYTHAVDMWSVGMILYMMLCNALPFSPEERKSHRHIYNRILRGLELPRYISPNCKDLLSQLLKLGADERLDATGLLQHTWLKT
ncbi:hypothetical protein ACJMK2_027857 [Sinanodonta woodiana]|uniref:non-specific serine/threonine protein kinase n=1 Tax=Sinanodonta woodiana TaxID=1069815 RepID=A0ABD3X5T4_SINWO